MMGHDNKEVEEGLIVFRVLIKSSQDSQAAFGHIDHFIILVRGTLCGCLHHKAPVLIRYIMHREAIDHRQNQSILTSVSMFVLFGRPKPVAQSKTTARNFDDPFLV